MSITALESAMTQQRRKFLTLSACAGLACLVTPQRGVAADVVGPEQWPQWRGPNRDGSVDQAWPSSVGEESLVQQWIRPFGESYSGPVANRAHVFTTETRDRKTEVIFALDRQSGETVWEASWPGAMEVPFYANRNGSWIRSTPALSEDRILVAGMLDHLVCLEINSGQKLWEIDLPKTMNSNPPDFGSVCSPIIEGGFAYMQAAVGLLKLDMSNGNTVWHVLKGKDSDSAFSSPILAELDGKRQLLVQTRERLVGVDLESGDTLWEKKIDAFRGMNILTPTVMGNRIFTSSYGGKAWMFNISATTDSAWTVEQSWENKQQAYMSTPVAIDGFIYMHLKNQRFTCVEAATGEIKWTTPPFGQYWSLLSNGKMILALDQTGDLRLIEASPEEYRPISERRVAMTETWAHLGVSGEQVFVRQLDGLTAFKWS